MTIAKVLDKKKMIKTGENAGRYHVKIRVTKTVDKRTIQKYFLTGVYATEAEWRKIDGNPGKDKSLQKKQTIISDLYEKGKEIIRVNPYVDFEAFENQITSKGGLKDPLGLMQTYVDELNEAGRVGTRDYYKSALSCFKEYLTKRCGGKMFFASVTPEWLMKWEKWMTADRTEDKKIIKGRSITTVGMYAIALRRIFNLAMSKKYKIIGKDLYPFGEGAYVIPTARGRKLALTEAQKDRLLKFSTLDIKARKGVDFWIFSYFCNGMNMADVCNLRFKNLPDGLIIFDRAKTRFTQRKKKDIIVISREEIQRVIETWGNKPGEMNDYVFPVLREGLSPQQQADRIHDFIDEINQGLSRAVAEMSVKGAFPKITTYSARHTSATIMRNKGASIEFIQEALGHADSKTTQVYLDSFDLETKTKYSNLL